MESNRWWAIGVVACSVVIGVGAYTLGLAQGAAHAASVNAGDWHGWHAHWGFPFAPVFAVFIWLWVIRWLFWGWGWGPRWRRHLRYSRYYGRYVDDPRWFDERLRRAHERMNDVREV